MNKTYWITTDELDAISRRLDYVDGISSGPTGGLLSERDPEFAKAKGIIAALKRGDQLFVQAA